MNALLINPAFPDTFWGYRHALRIVGKRALFPPLGLLTVAAMLPRQWSLRVADLNVRPLTDEELAWADSAWITGMSVQEPSAREVLRRCRDAGVRTVAGGPLFTCEPDQFPEADHLILDEAELTLPPFLADLAAGNPKPRYTTTEKPDVTTTPVPRFDLIRPRDYGSMCVQFSRGCPFDCDFCNVTSLFGKRPRTKTPQAVTAELDAIAATGYRGAVFFVDDNLIGNKHAARTLLPALRQWRTAHPHTRFFTEASINLADDAKLTADLVAAGFDTVFVGIETPDPAALEECHKRQNLKRDLVADVRKLHAAGLQVQAGMILGFDADNASTFDKLVEFIEHSRIMTAMVGLLQAPVGTRLYERLSLEGRLIGRFSGNNVAADTNVRTAMPLETLQAGYRTVMDRLYNARSFRRRLTWFLQDYRPPRHRGSFSPAQAWTFVRASWSLGVVARGRTEYWKLLAWVMSHRPAQLPLAVRLWVEGHHFRQICRRQLGVA